MPCLSFLRSYNFIRINDVVEIEDVVQPVVTTVAFTVHALGILERTLLQVREDADVEGQKQCIQRGQPAGQKV